MEMVFRVPLPPNLGNARMHWRVRHNQKKEYWQTLDGLQLVGQLPNPPQAPWTQALAAVRVFGYNYQDESNVFARLKFLEDWLVTRGYIIDDNRKVLSYTGIPSQTIDRKNPRIEFTLTRGDG